MATLQVTIRDTTYDAALASMAGADDAARLLELKRLVKDAIRDRVRFDQERAAYTTANVALQATIAAISAGLADPA